jgi:hypothetical protein
MMRTMAARMAGMALLATWAIVGAGSARVADGADGDHGAAASDGIKSRGKSDAVPSDTMQTEAVKTDAVNKDAVKPAAGKNKRFTGRLPPHYGQVVDEKQRQEIYRIQEEFGPKIHAAQQALDGLRKEQSEKMAAVLTPTQKKLVDEAAAKSKKKKTTADEADSGK